MLANHTLEFTTKTRQETLSSVFSAHYYMCLLKKKMLLFGTCSEKTIGASLEVKSSSQSKSNFKAGRASSELNWAES